MYFANHGNDGAKLFREVLPDSTQLPPNYIPSINWAEIAKKFYALDERNISQVSGWQLEQLQELVEKAIKGEL